MASELMEAKKKEQLKERSSENMRSGNVYVPRADIYETQEQLVILADMPGVKQEDVDITLEQNVLTIHGQVEVPSFDQFKLAYSEYGVGDYRRVFALSNEIDRDGIQATVKNGVLKLVLPKSKRAMPRKITVQSM
jgi:HSP20 family molecular chaperone IbpA